MSADLPKLRFQALQSSVDVAFWSDLANFKLNTLKLSEAPVPIQGSFTAGAHAEVSSPLQLDMHSLSASRPLFPGYIRVLGELHNVNTMDRYKGLTLAGDDNTRDTFIAAAVAQIWADIASGAAESQPALLWRFVTVTFAELKKYHFYYWFCFPALLPPAPITAQPPVPLNSDAALGPAISSEVVAACARQLQAAGDDSSRGSASGNDACCAVTIDQHGQANAFPISQWATAASQRAADSPHRVYLAVADPGNDESAPAWPLRNLLLLAAVRWQLREVTVVCLRTRKGSFDAGRSLLLHAHLPPLPEGWEPRGGMGGIEGASWERNARGRAGPRMVDLGSVLDPRRLAESAIDLNLSLMRWRAATELDTQKLAGTRCLLLGAGTLGCAVARTLLGWGVRTITFLDNSKVSFSNPVRQSLFTFQDCLEGGKPKAAAAAQSLQQIFPGVNAEGVELTVPMPGHAVAPSELAQVEEAVQQLQQMVQAHDIIFLLMDTREARWLPTLLAAAEGKLAINAALGFDSYLVMRHDIPSHPSPAAGQQHMQLGCYFCNDIIAPLDSTLDRTLDQQCTVARPGLASIAGALAVELMAAVLQHPEGARAPAASAQSSPESAASSPLGSAPHRIQGRLSGGFVQHCLTGPASRQCTACSPAIIQAYRQRGLPFLLDALQDPQKLLDISGMTALLQDVRHESELITESDEGLEAEHGHSAFDDGSVEDWTAL